MLCKICYVKNLQEFQWLFHSWDKDSLFTLYSKYLCGDRGRHLIKKEIHIWASKQRSSLNVTFKHKCKQMNKQQESLPPPECLCRHHRVTGRYEGSVICPPNPWWDRYVNTQCYSNKKCLCLMIVCTGVSELVVGNCQHMWIPLKSFRLHFRHLNRPHKHVITER